LIAALAESLGHKTRFITVGRTRTQQQHIAVQAFDGQRWVTLDPVLEKPQPTADPRPDDIGQFGRTPTGPARRLWSSRTGRPLGSPVNTGLRPLWPIVSAFPPQASYPSTPTAAALQPGPLAEYLSRDAIARGNRIADTLLGSWTDQADRDLWPIVPAFPSPIARPGPKSGPVTPLPGPLAEYLSRDAIGAGPPYSDIMLGSPVSRYKATLLATVRAFPADKSRPPAPGPITRAAPRPPAPLYLAPGSRSAMSGPRAAYLGIDPATAAAAAEKAPEIIETVKETWEDIKDFGSDVAEFFGFGKDKKPPKWKRDIAYWILQPEQREQIKNFLKKASKFKKKFFTGNTWIWEKQVTKAQAEEIMREHNFSPPPWFEPTKKKEKKKAKKPRVKSKEKTPRAKPEKLQPKAAPAPAPAAPVQVTVKTPELKQIKKILSRIEKRSAKAEKQQTKKEKKAAQKKKKAAAKKEKKQLLAQMQKIARKEAKRARKVPVAQMYDPQIRAYRVFGLSGPPPVALGAIRPTISFALGADPPGELFDTKYVQQLVKDLGGSISVDGIWGPGSRSALKSVCEKHGLLHSPRKAGDYYSSTSQGYPSGKVMVRPKGLIEALESKRAALQAPKRARAGGRARATTPQADPTKAQPTRPTEVPPEVKKKKKKKKAKAKGETAKERRARRKAERAAAKAARAAARAARAARGKKKPSAPAPAAPAPAAPAAPAPGQLMPAAPGAIPVMSTVPEALYSQCQAQLKQAKQSANKKKKAVKAAKAQIKALKKEKRALAKQLKQKAKAKRLVSANGKLVEIGRAKKDQGLPRLRKGNRRDDTWVWLILLGIALKK
jgi:hypothetical protein